jgi:hypothetical protein
MEVWSMFLDLYPEKDRERPFSINEAIDTFSDMDLKMSKKEKYLDKLLSSKNFYGYIFICKDDDGPKKEKLKKFYKTITHIDNLKCILNTLEDFRIDDYPRSSAAFIFTVCQYVLAECNDSAAKVDDDYRNGAIRRGEKEDRYDSIEEKFAYIKRINEYINDFIKPFAKKIYRKSGVPKDVAMTVIKNVPEKQYITKWQLGGFMNIITDALYQGIDDCEEIDRIDWEPFFESIVGKDLLKDVAVYLTVEGTSRIKRNWKNAARIQEIWDSLTTFALDTLEESPSDDIDHMIGIYKKMVAGMSGDEKNDLRVDLTKLKEEVFPNICKSVEKCYNTIKDAIKVAKGKKDRFKSDDEIETLN